MAVPGVGPTLEPGGVELAEMGIAVLPQGLDLKVLLPDSVLPQVLRKTGDEQVRRFDEMSVCGDDEILSHDSVTLLSELLFRKQEEARSAWRAVVGGSTKDRSVDIRRDHLLVAIQNRQYLVLLDGIECDDHFGDTQ